MRLASSARKCLPISQPFISKAFAASCVHQVRRQTRRYSQKPEPQKPRKTPREHIVGSSPINPINVRPRDAVNYLRDLFSPLEFPEDVAQRMITHVSWERGTEGHNGRLSFIGRRVLHTYLLLFLHECTLPSQNLPRSDTVAPSDLLRPSSFPTGGTIEPLSKTYEEISDKLLDTYILGEHVGGAWRLERIMRWTPAIAQLDTLKANDPGKILHGSGLYKIRGVTVEGVIGGVFHQFGGSIAHRIFHTRVLPHIYRFSLPQSLHGRVEEACERFGGREGLLLPEGSNSSPKRVQKLSVAARGVRTPTSLEDDSDLVGAEEEVLKGDVGDSSSRTKAERSVDYVQIRGKQRILERQKLGYPR